MYREVIKGLDKWENDCVPKLELSTKQISFGGEGLQSLRYLVTQTQQIVIENTGQVTAAWRFIPKPGEQRMCKPWLQMSPRYGMLLPGEKQTITVACCVYGGIAAAVLAQLDSLEDFMIIRLEKGGDHYIMVSGTYEPSCFGSDLLDLVKAHGPFRPLSGASREMVDAETRSRRLAEGEAHTQPVPKELWRLLNHLSDAAAMQEPNIFFVKGDEMQRRVVRQCLDSGQEFPKSVSFHSVASTMLDFLRALANPVVPIEYYPNVDLDTVAAQNWCASFLEDLPAINLNVLVYIIAFLKDLLSDENRAKNELQIASTCDLFARVLFRPGQAVVANKTRQSMSTAGGGVAEIFGTSWDERREVFKMASGEKVVAHLIQHYG